MKSPKNLVIAVLVVLAIVVVLQNTEAVQTRILFATITMPRALLLLITLAVGVVVGLLLGGKVGGPSSKE